MAKLERFFELKAPPMDVIDRLWKGSIDMHLHLAPAPTVSRRVDGYQAALSAKESGMRTIVLKSDFYPTAPVAAAVRSAVPEFECFGALNMEYITTGGFGPHAAEAVEQSAKMGAKVLWMPTFDAWYARKYIPGKEGTGLRILDDRGEKIPEVWETLKRVLDTVAKYDMVLANGHISYEETVVLFEEAKKYGVKKLVATHPMSDVIWPAMTMEQMKHLADMGAYIEHVFRNFLPLLGSYDPSLYVEAVKEIGAERTIMSTDLAQSTDCMPADGMRMFIGNMLEYGCTEEEVELMAKVNPARLLGLL